MKAHHGAWEAGILHRDISVDNIMRVVDQEREKDVVIQGILNDWDLSKRRKYLTALATQYGRSVSIFVMGLGFSLKRDLIGYVGIYVGPLSSIPLQAE